jgi:Leucine-rich repeat (LRR) protein
MLTDLQELNLSYNQITEINALAYLQILSLKNNQIPEMKSFTRIIFT